MMDAFFYQIKQAWAGLKKKPGFIAAVVLTLGTTLGALLCVLTLGYLLIFEPLPYPEQERLYKIEHNVLNAAGKVDLTDYTYPGFINLYEKEQVFSDKALLYYGREVLTSLSHQPTLNAAYVTAEWFPLLDTKFLMGHAFEQTTIKESHDPHAILSYNTWKKEFALADDILSKKVSFNGVSFRIIGVIAEHFIEPQIHEVGLKTDIWLSWDQNPDKQRQDDWGNISDSLVFVGKLKPSITVAQAEQSIAPLVNEIWQSNVSDIAFFKGWRINLVLHPFSEVILGKSQNTLYLLLAGVFGLVIIACANIANLFISRTAEKQHQLAINAALGAKKSQLFKLMLAETSLLMVFSITLALVVASFSFWLFQGYLAQVLPRVDELKINVFTLFLSCAFVIILALLFARLTTQMINYHALNTQLQSSGKGNGVQVSKKVRHALIMSQVAIATTLVFLNMSLFKSALDTIQAPLGFNLDNMVSLSLSSSTWPSREEVSADINQLREKIRSLPQVKSVASTSSPLSGDWPHSLTAVKTNERFTAIAKQVDHQYFQIIEQPLLEGDYFSHVDIKNKHSVVIVNDVFAERLAPEGSVIGMQFDSGYGLVTVVGIVRGIKMPGESEVAMRVYRCDPRPSNIVIQLKENQHISREQLVTMLKEVNSLYSIFSLKSLSKSKQQRLFTQITTAITTSALALISFFLASIGLYGILSYSTQMRRLELGTRLAIGAKRHDLIGLIIKDNAKPIIVGILLSVVISLSLYFCFTEQLVDYISIPVALMFIATLFLIAIISFLACYLPLRQFINLPPLHSLRGSN
jgi:predicted permease